jgi:hypothetical protein
LAGIHCRACGSASARKRKITSKSLRSCGSGQGRWGVGIGALWLAILALPVVMPMPEDGGWARVGFVLDAIWRSVAAAVRLALEGQFCAPPVRGDVHTGTEVRLNPRHPQAR